MLHWWGVMIWILSSSSPSPSFSSYHSGTNWSFVSSGPQMFWNCKGCFVSRQTLISPCFWGSPMVRLLLVMINPLYCISSVEVIFYFDTDILTSTSVRDLPNCSDRVFLDEGNGWVCHPHQFSKVSQVFGTGDLTGAFSFSECSKRLILPSLWWVCFDFSCVCILLYWYWHIFALHIKRWPHQIPN